MAGASGPARHLLSHGPPAGMRHPGRSSPGPQPGAPRSSLPGCTSPGRGGACGRRRSWRHWTAAGILRRSKQDRGTRPERHERQRWQTTLIACILSAAWKSLFGTCLRVPTALAFNVFAQVRGNRFRHRGGRRLRIRCYCCMPGTAYVPIKLTLGMYSYAVKVTLRQPASSTQGPCWNADGCKIKRNELKWSEME